jgi:hypothetical protein
MCIWNILNISCGNCTFNFIVEGNQVEVSFDRKFVNVLISGLNVTLMVGNWNEY